MVKCKNCGFPLNPDEEYCPNCGVASEQQPYGQQQDDQGDNLPPSDPGSAEESHDAMDDEPLGMWSYVGYLFLFSIPVVGFALMLVFALGGVRNTNAHNFARACIFYLVMMVILIVAAIHLSALVGAVSFTQKY